MDTIINRIVERLSRLSLSEAGRVLSKKNEGRVRTAAAELDAVLADMGIEAEAEEALSEAERSQGQTHGVLADAVRTSFGSEGCYAYIVDVYAAYLVYCLCVYGENGGHAGATRTLHQVEYQVSDSDVVTFGTPVAVVARMVYEPMSDAEISESAILEGDMIPLVEALKADGTGLIKVIAPGWGSSGYYPAEVLKRDGPKAFPAGTHMHIDHPTAREASERPERSIDSMAAVTTGAAAWQENGAKGPGLYAPIKVKSAHRQDIKDVAENIGVSIYASGTFQAGEAEGRKGRIVTALATQPTNTIDFVTHPGAGGGIVSLLESRRPSAVIAPTSSIEKEPAMAATLATIESTTAAESAEMIALRKEVARLGERARLAEARDFIGAQLAGPAQRLHPLTAARLQESLISRAVFNDAGVDVAATQAIIEAAVNDEMAYLAKLAGTGQIRDLGSLQEAHTSTTPQTQEQLAESLKNGFAGLGMPVDIAGAAGKGR